MYSHKLPLGRKVHILLAASVLFAPVGRATAASQNEQIVKISVNDPRPLAEVIATLEKRYGWVITYEDPPYVHASEISDVTQAVSRNYEPTKPKVLVPGGRQFDFSYAIPSGASGPSTAVLLDALLADYHLSGNPGMFRLLGTDPFFHVVPSMARNAQGVLETHRPVLDTNISVAAGSRTALEMIETILKRVSEATGTKVIAGTIPTNLLIGTRVQGGISNERARTALLRTLGATGLKLSWRLFHGPGTRLYVLNVHIVRAPQRQ